MPKRTLQQVIDATKAGETVSPKECREAMLALHSMLTKSRMALETVADKLDNAESLYYTARAFLGNIDALRIERERWMNTVSAEYMEEMEIRQREMLTFYENLQP